MAAHESFESNRFTLIMSHGCTKATTWDSKIVKIRAQKDQHLIENEQWADEREKNVRGWLTIIAPLA